MAKLKLYEITPKNKRRDRNHHKSNYRVNDNKHERFKVVRKMIRNMVKVAIVKYLLYGGDVDYIYDHRHKVLANWDY